MNIKQICCLLFVLLPSIKEVQIYDALINTLKSINLIGS